MLELQKQFGIAHFVETGTYKGGTTKWAAEHFDSVVTIELAEALYRPVVTRLGYLGNIDFRLGDTRKYLPEIAGSLAGHRTLYWLDGHWSGGKTSGSGDQCPLLEELAILGKATEAFLFIDDARLFLAPPSPPLDWEQWPTIAEVMGGLRWKELNRYVVIVEDVIIAVPSYARQPVKQYCQRVQISVKEFRRRLWKQRPLATRLALKLRQWFKAISGGRRPARTE